MYVAEQDSNLDSLSPVPKLLTITLHNLKGEVTGFFFFFFFQVILPFQPLSHFHEVRSHTENFNRCAFLIVVEL